MIRLPRLMSCVALAGAAFAAASLIPIPTFAAQQAADEKMAADNGAPAPGANSAKAAPKPAARGARTAAPAKTAAGATGAAKRGAPAAAPAGKTAAAPAAADAGAQPAAAKEDAAPEPDAAKEDAAPEPDAAKEDAAPEPDAAKEDAAPEPDAAAPDAAAPDAAAPAPDAAAPDAAAPDAAAPAPDAAAPDAAAPAPDAAAPAPDAAAPDAAAPAPDAAATAPAATEPAAAQPPQASSLGESVDNFWHYTLIARYDLAKAEGERILNSGSKPEEILAAFEQVAARRGRTRAGGAPSESLDAALIRWQGIDPLREVATKLQQTINQGYTTHVTDQGFIKLQLDRLGDNDRAYRNGVQRLKQSGQYAVPMMLRYLRDPAKRELHGPIRNALIDMGRLALNPLLAATEARDGNVLIPVISVLGQIHYPIAVPYLVKAGTDPQAPDSVRNAVERALGELTTNASNTNPADAFVELGEKFYYGTADVQPEKRSQTSPVWFWDEANGLSMKPVSSSVFNDVMAMRSAETALQIGGGQSDAASLWLAADNKREADMPAENGVDAVNANRPPAHFYNVALGVERLNNVLARALKDQNSAVALKAIRSLQGVAGQSNMFQGGVPLVDAMRFPDRTVRYESAMAIAASLPQQPFNGQEMVVPLLAEAVAQSGRPNVLLLVTSEADRSRLAGELKSYNVAGGIGATGAMAEARSLPSVDAILVAPDVKDNEIEQLVRLARENGRLDRTAKIIARNNGGGMWAREAINDPTLSITQATDAEGLGKAIEAGRAKTGGLPLDEKVANDFAMRAATHLSRLAISRGQVLDLSPALTSLLGSLGDPRPEIVRAVGEAVALVPSPQVQPALVDRAQDAKNAEEVRASLYRSLATSAKFFGNQLQEQQIGSLRENVAGEQNLDVRSAAAEALGALNVPVGNVAQLITEPTAAPTQAQPPAGGQQPAAAGQ